MAKIDLNADLGEGGSADAELMTLVSSVNIAWSACVMRLSTAWR